MFSLEESLGTLLIPEIQVLNSVIDRFPFIIKGPSILARAEDRGAVPRGYD